MIPLPDALLREPSVGADIYPGLIIPEGYCFPYSSNRPEGIQLHNIIILWIILVRRTPFDRDDLLDQPEGWYLP